MSAPPPFFARACARILARRRLVLGLFALGIALSAAALPRLRIELSPSAAIGADMSEAQRIFDRYRADFGRDDEQIVIVARAPGPVLTPARLDVLEALSARIEGLDGVVRVGGVHRVPVPLDEGGALSVRPLSEAVARAADPDALRAAAGQSPLLTPALLNRAGDAALLVVTLDEGTDAIEILRPRVDAVQAAARAFEGRAGLRFALAGIPVMRARFITLTARDQGRLFPLALLVMGGLLAWIFRSTLGVLIPAGAAFLPVLFLGALMALTGEPVGMVNQVFFTLIPALAVADAIHLLRAITLARAAPSGAGDLADICRATGEVGRACLLTTLTTCVGFLSLATSSIGVLRSFGVYAAAGMAIAFVVVLTLVPVLASLTGPGALKAAPGGAFEGLARFFSRLTTRRAALQLGAVALLCALAAPFAARVRIDNAYSALLPRDLPVAAQNRALDEEFGGILPMAVVIDARGDAAFRPEVVAAVDRLVRFARDLPGVGAAAGISDVLRALQRGLVPDTPRGGALDGATIAQLRLLAGDEAFAAFLRPGKMRVLLGVQDRGGNHVRALAARVRDEARALFDPLGVPVVVTGTAAASYGKFAALVRDLRTSILGALVVIGLLLLAVFRRPWWVLLATVSNLLPLYLAYAALGAFDIPLDVAPAVIFAVGLGLAVDDTIHFLSGFFRRRETLSARRAVEGCVRAAGFSIVATSVVLAAGFFVHMSSRFPSIATIGMVGGVIVLAALLGDVVLLPAVVWLLAKEDRGEDAP